MTTPRTFPREFSSFQARERQRLWADAILTRHSHAGLMIGLEVWARFDRCAATGMIKSYSVVSSWPEPLLRLLHDRVFVSSSLGIRKRSAAAHSELINDHADNRCPRACVLFCWQPRKRSERD